MKEESFYYFDTNIFIAYFLGKGWEPKKHHIVKEYIASIIEKNEHVLISHLNLIEVFSVIRKHISRDFDKLNTLNDEKRKEYVFTNSKCIYDELIAKLLKSPQIFVFDVKNRISVDTEDLFFEALSLSRKMKGRVDLYHFCNNCKYQKQQKFISGQKIADVVDLIHLFIAKNSNCEKFITMDKGFKEIELYNEINPLKIDVLDAPYEDKVY